MYLSNFTVGVVDNSLHDIDINYISSRHDGLPSMKLLWNSDAVKLLSLYKGYLVLS